MIPQSSIDSIFASDPKYKKHFLLKNLTLKGEDFLYLSIKEDSTGKDLESIMNTLDHFYTEVENLGQINLIYSFKEIEYFSDIGLSLTIRLSEVIRAKGGKFIVLEPRKYPRQVMEMMELDEDWLIYNSESEFFEEMKD
ncbi:anti-sigma factor antagonist [Pontibacter sp. FD36]|uniref:anti-sigma factor antagonist n=1 Tax=Pontibacter sp. FD36 TaxID=2789860 RepID=UPI0018AC6753|nr:anti-sigma factor antagonist [Pontibacter sp. FD36]MBF8964310.1 anti-sigma factor antagonist [Pontibacter sp. FD36]